MGESNIPKIDVDEILEMIRAEVGEKNEHISTPCPLATGEFDANASRSNLKINMASTEASAHEETGSFEYKEDGYHINDFLRYHDRQFVINAFRGILRREPDSGAGDYFLKNLRSGKMTKAEILGRLRYAPEGRIKKVAIRGLFWNFLVQSSYRIPILGYFFRLMVGIMNFPAISRNLSIFENNISAQIHTSQEALANKIHELILEQEKVVRSLAHKADFDELNSLKELKADRDELNSLKELKADQDELNFLKSSKADHEELVNLNETKANQKDVEVIGDQLSEILRQIRDHKLNIVDQQRRLKNFLKEARRKLPESNVTEQFRQLADEESHILDAMYMTFEERFRGTREDVKQRQRIYLPYIRDMGPKIKVIDVGCGRGEWLELLKEEAIQAKGIDLNRVAVEECRRLNLDVVQGDAIDYLGTLKDGSVEVVTGFHIVEHLPTGDIISLFDESFRVLKSSGIVIFETPNPENVLVGSCTFYNDPSHKHPIPPDTLEFLISYRGFVDLEVIRLYPLNDISYSEGGDLEKIVHRFNMERDYAVIGRRS